MEIYECSSGQHIWIVAPDGLVFGFSGRSVPGHLKVFARYQNNEKHLFAVAENHRVYRTYRGVLERLAVGGGGQTFDIRKYRLADILFWSELPSEAEPLVRRAFPKCSHRLDKNAEPI